MKERYMEILLTALSLVMVLILLSFINNASPLQETSAKSKVVRANKSVVDTTKLIKYITDKNPQQTKLLAQEQYNICPPLCSERFRRRIKMLWGVDINDYPDNAKIRFSSYDIIISKEYQTLEWMSSIYDEDAPFTILKHPRLAYRILRHYILLNNPDAFDDFITYTNKAVQDIFDKDNIIFDVEIYANNDLLQSFYYSALFNVSPTLTQHIDKYNNRGLLPFQNYTFSSRPTDRRLDYLTLFIKKEMKNGREIEGEERNRIFLHLNFKDIPLNAENLMSEYISAAVSYNTLYKNKGEMTDVPPTPWKNYCSEKGVSALLSFFLHFNNKVQNKFVIQYMTGQADRYLHTQEYNNRKMQNNIRSNNYYGYTLLREFCENPMREMPTLEKTGTSFRANVKGKNTLLLLEPFKESYDIDTIQPCEFLTAYEMGHDDYWFIEVTKPVESAVAGPDGYAMILDRTEVVYGYISKDKVKKLSDADILQMETTADLSKSKTGLVQDPDGYVNIRKEQNTRSEILGRITTGESFLYWELPENWYVVQTRDNIRGYVYKDRIREKKDTGGWTLEK